MITPDQGDWVRRYDDDSGDEFVVWYDRTGRNDSGEPAFGVKCRADLVIIPSSEMEWFVDRILAARTALLARE